MKTAHKLAQLFVTLAVLTALPGCGYLAMSCHEVGAWTSRHWSAEKAWHSRHWMYADIPCRGSFKAGFKAGYRFASGGYDSCEPPQLRHYWRIGGLTESERQNAQAWSDGFTHGTVAAQQDHAVVPSTLDMAAMQPPAGVPDVRYYTPPQMSPDMMSPDMTGGGGFQYPPNAQPQIPSPYQVQAPAPYEEQASSGYQFQQAPAGANFQYSPAAGPMSYAPNGAAVQYGGGSVPPPAPASEAAPAPYGAPVPYAVPAPNGMPLPPPAPISEPAAAADPRYPQAPVTLSEGSPGIGSLRMAANLQPAPPAEAEQWLPRQSAANPPRQATQAADWELPIIRD